MKHPEAHLWAVQVTRRSTCIVYIETTDPAEARTIAAREADDYTDTITTIAYTVEGRPPDRVFRDGRWHYPETDMFA